MEESNFHLRLRSILELEYREGPHSNIVHYVQDACKMLKELRSEIISTILHIGEPTEASLLQVAACDLYLPSLFVQVEEYEQAFSALKRGSVLLLTVCEKKDSVKWIVENMNNFPLPTFSEIELQITSYADLTTFPFWGPSLSLRSLYGIVKCSGYSSTHSSHEDTINDNIFHILQRLETEYNRWNGAAPAALVPKIEEFQWGENNELKLANVSKGMLPLYWERYNMEEIRFGTSLSLAQFYTSLNDTKATMQALNTALYLQIALHKYPETLLSLRNDILRLADLYCDNGAFEEALHYLHAAEALTPKDDPDEETLGKLLWAYGKFHEYRLQHYAKLHRRNVEQEYKGQKCFKESGRREFNDGWLNLPLKGVPPWVSLSPITNFNEAREEFKEGTKRLEAALEFFPFELLCSLHINITQDICRLYESLSVFETDESRKIAYVQREISLLEGFPAKLNFNAYPTLIRQLLYDIGCLRETLVELRLAQRQRCQSTAGVISEKPISDNAVNKLIEKAMKYFQSFCQTWMNERVVEEHKNNNLPPPHPTTIIVEKESREVFFRSLMRCAHLTTLKAFSSPREEFEGIEQACKDYQIALKFFENNPFSSDSTVNSKSEVECVKELIDVLHVKQTDLLRAFASG